MLRNTALSVLIPVLAGALWAQDPPPAAKPTPPDAEALAAAIEAATAELRRLAPQRARLPAETWSAAEAKLGEATTAFLACEVSSFEHFARAIQTTWQTQCPGACALLCERALQRFEPTAELQSQLGSSRWAMARNAAGPFDTRHNAALAAAAFAASRRLGEREPAYAFAWASRFCACDFDGALADLATVAAHEQYGESARSALHRLRAMTMLGAGRGDEAMKEFAAADAADEGRDEDHEVLAVRALVLAGRADEAIAAARTAHANQPRQENVALVADALAATGKYDEALAWLRQHALVRGTHSEARFVELQRSRQALVFFIEQRGKRPPDLRQQLTALLGLQVKVGTLDGLFVHHGVGDGAVKVDITASPQALGTWLCAQRGTAFTWATEALFVICVEDAPGWAGGDFELGLLRAVVPPEHWQAVTGDGALAAARAALAGERIMPGAEGVLTAGRLLGL